jgi:ABC-type branched-subunit amino acid transport system permease subunit
VKEFLTRRKLLTSGAITLGGLALSGCDPLSRSPEFRTFLRSGEKLTMGAQRALMVGQPLAREFSEYRMLIFGLVMILMMVWRPQGLFPVTRNHVKVPAKRSA